MKIVNFYEKFKGRKDDNVKGIINFFKQAKTMFRQIKKKLKGIF